jgi:hypothetical protein
MLIEDQAENGSARLLTTLDLHLGLNLPVPGRGAFKRRPGRLISATVTQLRMQIKRFANRFAKPS